MVPSIQVFIQLANGLKMCLRCTAWGETQEPGVTPTPLQTGHISVEEQNKEVWNKKFTESTDFFPDDSLPQVCSISLRLDRVTEC